MSKYAPRGDLPFGFGKNQTLRPILEKMQRRYVENEREMLKLNAEKEALQKELYHINIRLENENLRKEIENMRAALLLAHGGKE